MDTYDNSMAVRFKGLLARRLVELGVALQEDSPGRAAAQAPEHEVQDFKDVANSHTLATVHDTQSANAAHELDRVTAAQRRLEDQTYGHCLNCGKPIDLRRLEALPDTPHCRACQAQAERSPAERRS